jgi:hypothetical protein
MEAIKADAAKASSLDGPKPAPSPPSAPVPGVVAAAAPPALAREKPPEAPATAKTSVTPLPARLREEVKPTQPEPSAKLQDRSAAQPYTLPRGVRYEGEWKDGKPAGRGQFFYESGDHYSGEVADGQRHGHGRMTRARGGFWEGEFINDRQVLDGQMLVQTGDMTMEGRFAVDAAGRVTGSGKLTWTNGDSYVGEVKNGEPHGQGTYRLSNGDTYSGAWERGLKHGHGRLTWARGGAWEGEFRNDQQTERGHMLAGGASPAQPESKPPAERKVSP